MPDDSQRRFDRQTDTDLSLSRLLVLAIIVGIVFGGAILLEGDVLLQSSGRLIAVVVGALLAFYVLDVITRKRWTSIADARRARAHSERRIPAPIQGVFEIFKFCCGIALGIGFALLAMQQNRVDGLTVAWLVVVAGIVCLFKQGWRSLGVGLILSIPLGILTLVTLCFATFKYG